MCNKGNDVVFAWFFEDLRHQIQEVWPAGWCLLEASQCASEMWWMSSGLGQEAARGAALPPPSCSHLAQEGGERQEAITTLAKGNGSCQYAWALASCVVICKELLGSVQVMVDSSSPSRGRRDGTSLTRRTSQRSGNQPGDKERSPAVPDCCSIEYMQVTACRLSLNRVQTRVYHTSRKMRSFRATKEIVLLNPQHRKHFSTSLSGFFEASLISHTTHIL